MEKPNKSPFILSPVLLCLLMGTLHPLTSSCQTMKKPEHPPKMKSLAELEKGLPKTIEPLEALELIEASDIREQPHSHPPVYMDEKENVLNGYYRIQYSSSVPGSDYGGQLRYMVEIGHFVRGIKEGKWVTEYYADREALDYTEFYKNGLLDGPFIVYNADKSTRYRTTFHEGTGVWKAFYPTGKPKIVGTYQRGRAHGKWYTYDGDGQLLKEETYQGGQLVSTGSKP